MGAVVLESGVSYMSPISRVDLRREVMGIAEARQRLWGSAIGSGVTCSRSRWRWTPYTGPLVHQQAG